MGKMLYIGLSEKERQRDRTTAEQRGWRDICSPEGIRVPRIDVPTCFRRPGNHLPQPWGKRETSSLSSAIVGSRKVQPGPR